jgi:hypothetical protein
MRQRAELANAGAEDVLSITQTARKRCDAKGWCLAGFRVELGAEGEIPQRMENSEWRTANGEQRMENSEWKTANGKQRMENSEWRTANGKQRMGNSEWRTANGVVHDTILETACAVVTLTESDLSP